MDNKIDPNDPKLSLYDKLQGMDDRLTNITLNIEEIMFKVEHFKTRITRENVISKELLFSEEYQYDTRNSIVRSKLWWLYKEWDTLNLDDLNYLMDGFMYWNKKIFSVEDFYKVLFLEVVIEHRIQILKNKPVDTNLEDLVKEAHKYAIARAYESYIMANDESFEEEDFEHPLIFEFRDAYFGKPVIKVVNFNRFENIRKVYFEEDQWILAFHLGCGWYLSLTRPNSYYPIK